MTWFDAVVLPCGSLDLHIPVTGSMVPARSRPVRSAGSQKRIVLRGLLRFVACAEVRRQLAGQGLQPLPWSAHLSCQAATRSTPYNVRKAIADGAPTLDAGWRDVPVSLNCQLLLEELK